MHVQTTSYDLEFDRHGNLLGISRNGQSMNLQGRFWQLTLGKGNGNYRTCTTKDTFFRVECENGVIKADWDHPLFNFGVKIQEINQQLHMVARVWTETDGIHHIQFPYFEKIRNLSPERNENYMIFPWQNSILVRDPIQSILCQDQPGSFGTGRCGKGFCESDYPSSLSYQFTIFGAGHKGFYLAAHDADCFYKTFGIYNQGGEDSFDCAITHYPDEIGDAACYVMSYPVVLFPLQEGWQEGVRAYRQFATQQKWCRKGKIKNRKLRPLAAETDLWHISSRKPSPGLDFVHYAESSGVLKDFLKCTVSNQWYGQDTDEHLTEKPAASACSQLREYTHELRREGIETVLTGTSCLTDCFPASWTEQHIRDAMLDENGAPVRKRPDAQISMCPASSLWQNTVAGGTRDYIKDFGFSGICLDQMVFQDVTPCFNPEHHHSSGGTWWARSHRQMTDEIRSQLDPLSIITSDSCCEAYLGCFDIFPASRIPEGNQTPVPLFSMIYGDYSVVCGTPCSMEQDDLLLFTYQMVQSLLWGQVPAVQAASPKVLRDGRKKGHWQILHQCVDFYRANQKLLLGGRLEQVPEADRGRLPLPSGGCIPEVLVYSWEYDGKLFWMGYNFAFHERTVMLEGDPVVFPAREFLLQPR